MQYLSGLSFFVHFLHMQKNRYKKDCKTESFHKCRSSNISVTERKIRNSQDKVIYTSSNPKVAKVDKKGKIRARKAGKATITVKAGKKTFRCTVKVTK